jgi:hypothetical protein
MGEASDDVKDCGRSVKQWLRRVRRSALETTSNRPFTSVYVGRGGFCNLGF